MNVSSTNVSYSFYFQGLLSSSSLNFLLPKFSSHFSISVTVHARTPKATFSAFIYNMFYSIIIKQDPKIPSELKIKNYIQRSLSITCILL